MTTIPSNPPNIAQGGAGGLQSLAVAGAIHALSYIIAARLIILVMAGGAIWLTWEAIRRPDPNVLVALGVYCAATVVVTWLVGRK